ncbi:mediator of RNA polymerase II transcription subunit 22-like isoform X1 [Babylonia areolata]|uniref:mediator of RNA polymerase II transcription subunit 22-like isoform X1 n=1 Tax=Babylonia areolata TaxID=304850 RepID=UPI003FCF3338
MSQGGQRAMPQSKEAQLRDYTMRLKSNVKAMFENFTEIIKLARIPVSQVEEDGQLQRSTQNEQDHYEMQVRAANIVRAGESLMKLVADLKQFRILNDFPSVNDSITGNVHLYQDMQNQIDTKLMALRDEMAADLFELEEEYYSSVYK